MTMTRFGELLQTLVTYEDSWEYEITGWANNKREWLRYKPSTTEIKSRYGYIHIRTNEILKINVTRKFDFDVGQSSVLSLEDKQALWDSFEALRLKKGGPERVDDDFNMRKVQDKTRKANRNRLFKKVFNEILGTGR